MSTHRRVTLAWVNLSIAALLYSMAWAQQQTPKGPSIPMEYCATVNTADMIGPCELLLSTSIPHLMLTGCSFYSQLQLAERWPLYGQLH